MKKLVYLGLISLSLMVACQEQSQSSSNSTEGETNLKQFTETRSYVELNCLSCHSETAGEQERLAPPFYAIRKHYLNRFAKEEDFVAAMAGFLTHPQKAVALMKGAVEKFGLMPSLIYPEGKAEAIARYLYHSEQKRPAVHQASEEDPLEQGKSWAMATKKVLGKNLMQALQDSGKYYALDFCNQRAYPLTDSMSDKFAHSIRRVSDKPRNPANKADRREMEVLTLFKEQLASGAKIKPQLKEMKEKRFAYYPILTNGMCLQCHGELGEELEEDFYNSVLERYPEDQAIGYQANQLRGMWVVEL